MINIRVVAGTRTRAFQVIDDILRLRAITNPKRNSFKLNELQTVRPMLTLDVLDTKHIRNAYYILVDICKRNIVSLFFMN